MAKIRKLHFPGLDIDERSRKVFKNGAEVSLPESEFSLLVYLAQREGEMLTRQLIYHDLWGIENINSRLLDVHVFNLRRKLGETPGLFECQYIRTLMGVGYQFLGEPPTQVFWDSNNRLHSEIGLAAVGVNGPMAWAIHGVIVPKILVEEPQKLTCQMALAQTNAEVRRLMIEKIGLDRFIQEGVARLVHEDPLGKLWRFPLLPRLHHPLQRPVWNFLSPNTRRAARREALNILELTNSTPEADGSYKHYFLRVPPRIRTATSAVAWTFGIRPIDYLPVMET